MSLERGNCFNERSYYNTGTAKRFTIKQRIKTGRTGTGISEKTSRGRERRIKPFGTKGALIHPYGCVRSAEGLSAQRESRLLPSLTDIGGFAATRGCTPCAAYAAIPAHPQNGTPAVGVCTIFAGFIILSGR